jgi:hypothetical protein
MSGKCHLTFAGAMEIESLKIWLYKGVTELNHTQHALAALKFNKN